jgi:Ohr subfamily peroxiredoxin
MSTDARILYTAKTRTTGGRDNGYSRSSDGRLDIRFSTPGSARLGTNPEQLLAAGWSASFASALARAAHDRNVALPVGLFVDAEVNLHAGNDGYALSARLTINVPEVSRDLVQALIDDAERLCPYAKATRNNMSVVIRLV